MVMVCLPALMRSGADLVLGKGPRGRSDWRDLHPRGWLARGWVDPEAC